MPGIVSVMQPARGVKIALKFHSFFAENLKDIRYLCSLKAIL